VDVWTDKDENFNLLDKILIKKLTIWHLKAFCNQSHGHKVSDFIKLLEKEFKHITDSAAELELEAERALLSMSRRFQEAYEPLPKKKHPKMKETSEEGVAAEEEKVEEE
jgi:hypothetical protein